MALAEKLHHSAYRSVPLKEELVEHEKHIAPRGQKTASGRGTEFFDVFDEELGGGRPPPLPEVAGPQARVLRRTVEPIIESFDALVPQMVDQAAEVVRFFASLPVVAEQVIEVPTIILEDPIPQRALLRVPQLAEQLVEVPTTTGYVFAVVAVQTMGVAGSTCSVRAAHRQSRAGYKYWTGLRRVRAPVVDVPVIISDMLQQFFVENVEVPQTQFFDRVVARLLSQRQGCTVQTVQKTGDSPGAVL